MEKSDLEKQIDEADKTIRALGKMKASLSTQVNVIYSTKKSYSVKEVLPRYKMLLLKNLFLLWPFSLKSNRGESHTFFGSLLRFDDDKKDSLLFLLMDKMCNLRSLILWRAKAADFFGVFQHVRFKKNAV